MKFPACALLFLLTTGSAGMAVFTQNTGSKERKSPADVSSESTKGEAVFKKYCALCHYDTSAATKIGPGLKGIYTRGRFMDGKKVDDAAMVRWIQNGGKDMPPMNDKLAPDEIRALLSYLKTI
jgi:mono/diheme cytochrome c family protein